MMKSLLISAAVLVTPMAASAITVTDGSSASFSANLNPGGVVTYDFDFADSRAYNVYFTLAVSGQANDIGNVSYGFDHDTSIHFTNITTNGPISSASATYSFTTSSPFSFSFFDGIQQSVTTGLTYYFEAAAPAPVPVPAAGLMLLAGLGGLAAVRRRKA